MLLVFFADLDSTKHYPRHKPIFATNDFVETVDQWWLSQLFTLSRRIFPKPTYTDTHTDAFAAGEDESAYGGSNMSGISSVRNSGVPENSNKKAGDGDDDLKVDVGLTVRLQHKLKETQMAKEKLEKRLEILEQQTKDLRGGIGSGVEATSGSGSKRNADSIKINELEIGMTS